MRKLSAPTSAADTASSPTVAMTHREVLEAMTGLLAGLFTALLSTTIVSTALPTIVGDLKGTQTQYAWVVTVALLANAASTPIWGKLSDLFNKKLLVQLSLIIFVAGSALAGAAHNMELLLVGRVVQGLGMGGLTALVVAIIGSIVPPRERGRYSGYMGAVMAVAKAGGPVIGGVIADSPLGWRWCFYVCIPLAVVALGLLQRTLHLETQRKSEVSIDWLGATLMTAGVSVLLIWVSFAGKADYYEWISPESAYYVIGGLALLGLTVYVESKAKDPVIPLKIIAERTTALAIIASVMVGLALFGAITFLGQYFQTARHYSPTEAGLLTIPMVVGMLTGTMFSGLMITRFGKWKPFIIGGSILLTIGLALLGTIDHATPIAAISVYMFVMGLGTGSLMQNLVLAVQNTVSVQDIGAASANVAFFRTFGGAIGVSVLGSVLATHVADLSESGLAKLGIDTSKQSGGGNLDIKSLPEPVADVIRHAYGDATATIFQIGAACAVVAIIAILFIPNRPLRKTIDIETPAVEASGTEADAPSRTAG